MQATETELAQLLTCRSVYPFEGMSDGAETIGEHGAVRVGRGIQPRYLIRTSGNPPVVRPVGRFVAPWWTPPICRDVVEVETGTTRLVFERRHFAEQEGVARPVTHRCNR